MKNVLAFALIASAFSVSVAFAEETYYNFPTITTEYSKSEMAACQSWFAEKSAKFGDRIVASESGCKKIEVRDMNGASKFPQYKTKIAGRVVLDTL